ncbi:MAG TPA: diaminopimelate epimerase [Gemmatimonadales bacterium]|nr:diaminopimelate epimerase [Gemmatimonadales bacterium]
MTGSGNDFVMVDGRVTTPDDWTVGDIRSVCARGTGIGADGLVFVSPAASPSQAGARMVYFNSDGSRAAMCGNAALCSTRFAALLAIAPPELMRLETDAATYESRCAADGERAELHLATVAAPTTPAVRLGPGERRVGLAVVGVPHLVVVVEDLEAVDLPRRGRELRFDAALGNGGANVNFIAPTAKRSVWAMRTYERGIEGETLACGTGAVAAACLLREWRLADLPATIMTRSGLALGVRAERSRDGRYQEVWLEGQARLVFRGVLTS